MKLLKRYILLMFLIPLVSGCPKQEGTSGGNPFEVVTGLVVTGSSKVATVALNFFDRIYSLFVPSAVALPAPIMRDSSGRIVTLTQAWISFKDIEFKTEEFAGGGEVPGSDVTFAGPFYVDLLDPAPMPLEVGAVKYQAYRRVQASLNKQVVLPVGVPAEMSGNSVFLEGTIDGMPFMFLSEESNAFIVAGPNPIAPSEAESLLMSFYFAEMFKKINLSVIGGPVVINGSNKVVFANPCPTIDPGAGDLYQCFTVGLQTETNLASDLNGNAEVDGGEPSVD